MHRPLSHGTNLLHMSIKDLFYKKLSISKKPLVQGIGQNFSQYSISPYLVFSVYRGGFKFSATSKMEGFVRIVNGFQPLTTITKRSILDVAAVLDLPLV